MSDPSAGVDAYPRVANILPFYLDHGKTYRWSNWKQKLFGKVNPASPTDDAKPIRCSRILMETTLKPTSPHIHPKFQLNGLAFGSAEEILNFAEEASLKKATILKSVWPNSFEWGLNFKEYVVVHTSGSTGKPKNSVTQITDDWKRPRHGAYFKVGENQGTALPFFGIHCWQNDASTLWNWDGTYTW